VVPAEVTQAVLSDEQPAIAAWAERHGWTLTIDPNEATVTATTTHPRTEQAVIFHADLSGYPAIPPAWTCRDNQGNSPAAAYPLPGTSSALPTSIFHTQPVICAPWNRLAYATHGGPHGDWTAVTSWKTAAGEATQAHTIADMLSALRLHLSVSPGLQP
jgi:hypothetical protein